MCKGPVAEGAAEKSPEAIMPRSKGVWFRVDPEKPDSYLLGVGGTSEVNKPQGAHRLVGDTDT